MGSNDESSSGPTTPLLVLMVLGILFGPKAAGPTTPPAADAVAGPEVPHAGPAPVATREPGPLGPICEFLGAEAPGASGLGIPKGLDAYHYQDVDFLIATLPDPDDSRYGYRFDLTLFAIQRAVEDHQYILDGYWLPWKVAGPAARPKDDKGAPPDAPKDGPSPPGADPRRSPGVILYRNYDDEGDSDHVRLLALFLVGETATSGIRKDAFKAACDLGLALRGPAGRSREVRVIGPYFSGTAATLVRAIGQWRAEPAGACRGVDEAGVRFAIYTGSATSIGEGVLRADPDRIRFQSTAVPDAIVRRRLFEYLKGRDPSLSKVVLLTESDTLFGATETQQNGLHVLEVPYPLHISDVRTNFDRGRPAQGAAGKESGPPQLVTPFDRIPIPTDDGGDPKDIVRSLRPGMTTPTERLLLSRILATISQEGAHYVGIVASDTRDRIFLIRLIRFYFPDVQVFFNDNDLLLSYPEYSQYLRGTIIATTYPLYPPNQKWTYPYLGGAKRLLFSQESDEGYYNATLAQLNEARGAGVEPVPLLDYAQPFEWLRPPELRLKDYYREMRTPPVWISVVGEHGSWPVRVYPPRENYRDGDAIAEFVYPYGKRWPGPGDPSCAGEPPRADVAIEAAGGSTREEVDRLQAPALSKSWTTLFAGASLFCLAVSYAALRARAEDGARPGGLARRVVRRLPFLGLFRPRGRAYRASQDWAILGYFATLGLAYGFAARPTALPITVALLTDPVRLLHPRAWPTLWGPPVLALATLGALLVAQAGCCLRPALRPGAGEGVGPRRSLDLAVASIAVFALTAAQALRLLVVPLLTLMDRGTPGFSERFPPDYFAFDRTVLLASGVSPLLPTLCLAAAACLGFHTALKRLYLADQFRVRGPFPPDADGRFRAIVEGDRGIAELLNPGPSGWLRPQTLLAWVALAFFLSALRGGFLPTVEGRAFDRIVAAAFALLSLALAGELVRLLMLWRLVARILRQIARMPWAGAFGRLPPQIPILFGRYLTAPKPRRSHLDIPVQQVEYLRAQFRAHREATRGYLLATLKCPAGPVAALDDLVPEDLPGRYVDELRVLRGVDRPGAACDYDVSGQTQARLHEAAQACLRVLRHQWPTLPASEAFGAAEAGGPPDAAPAPDAAPDADAATARRWLRAAEDFVAMEAVLYISQYAVHLRNLTTFLTAGPLLLLLAATWYPFQPQRLLSLFCWTFIAGALGAITVVFLQMERDELVSRISKTPPNRVYFDRQFVTSFLTYLLPVLGVLASQFPDVSDLFNSIVEPLYRAIK